MACSLDLAKPRLSRFCASQSVAGNAERVGHWYRFATFAVLRLVLNPARPAGRRKTLEKAWRRPPSQQKAEFRLFAPPDQLVKVQGVGPLQSVTINEDLALARRGSVAQEL